jgi:hypothetical protein
MKNVALMSGFALAMLIIFVVVILKVISKDCLLDIDKSSCQSDGKGLTISVKQEPSGLFGKKCVTPSTECKLGDGAFQTTLYSGCTECRVGNDSSIGCASDPTQRAWSFCEDSTGTYWGGGASNIGHSSYGATNAASAYTIARGVAAAANPVYKCSDIVRPDDGTQYFTKDVDLSSYDAQGTNSPATAAITGCYNSAGTETVSAPTVTEALENNPLSQNSNAK